MTEKTEPADLGIMLTLALRCFVDGLHQGLGGQGFQDLRPPFGVIFRALRDGPLTLTALAARLGVTKQSAAKLVDEMVAKGLIERSDSDLDGRAKLLGLTDRGRLAMATAIGVGKDIERRLVDAVGPDEEQQFRRTMEAFIHLFGGGEDLIHRRSRAI